MAAKAAAVPGVPTELADVAELESLFVHLSRVALAGRSQDVQRLLQRAVRRMRDGHPELAIQLAALLREAPTITSPLRDAAMPTLPIDADSQQNLARVEDPVVLDHSPIWDKCVAGPLHQLIQERSFDRELFAAGLQPTSTAIFIGPPGVGKTMASRWVAQQLSRPLVTLDLSAVMSSFLGRTGNNVRNVLDYAKGTRCVLLLDEIDAIAKRRDDDVEVGELKRLVTVLLQEIDDWPSTSLLIAATNHAGLLDPAIWRRFELIIEFPMPSPEQTAQAVHSYFRTPPPKALGEALAQLFHGLSFSDIAREVIRIQRSAIVRGDDLASQLPLLIRSKAASLPPAARRSLALRLRELGWSAYLINELTGVSRDYIRDNGPATKATTTRRKTAGAQKRG